MFEDRLLIRRFNRGDPDALRCIYHKYRDDLLKVAAALTNDAAAVEDVLHDVFVSFAQTAGRFQLTGALKGYLAICVANRTRDLNRHAARRATVTLDAAAQLTSGVSRPEHAAIANELTQQLHSAMTQLPSQQREVIVLHLQAKARFREIAQSQDVSINTIQSRYRYGLAKLRSTLDGKLP